MPEPRRGAEPIGTPVFFDHDGGLDDYLSLLLLLTYDIDLLGISITPADTLLEGAVPSTRKILDLAGRSAITVAAGTLYAVISPFTRRHAGTGGMVRVP